MFCFDIQLRYEMRRSAQNAWRRDIWLSCMRTPVPDNGRMRMKNVPWLNACEYVPWARAGPLFYWGFLFFPPLNSLTTVTKMSGKWVYEKCTVYQIRL